MFVVVYVFIIFEVIFIVICCVGDCVVCVDGFVIECDIVELMLGVVKCYVVVFDHCVDLLVGVKLCAVEVVIAMCGGLWSVVCGGYLVDIGACFVFAYIIAGVG